MAKATFFLASFTVALTRFAGKTLANLGKEKRKMRGKSRLEIKQRIGEVGKEQYQREKKEAEGLASFKRILKRFQRKVVKKAKLEIWIMNQRTQKNLSGKVK